MQGAHAQRSDSGEGQHHRNTAHVSGHDHQNSGNGSQRVTSIVDLVHAAQFCDNRRHKQKTDNHGDIQCGSKGAHQVLITQNIGHVVGANTGESGVELCQQINTQDQQIILVLNQQAGGLTQGVLFFGSRDIFPGFIFFFGQLLQGQNRDGIRDDADDNINQRNDSPSGCGIAKVFHQAEGSSLDNGAGCKRKNEAERTQLNTLIFVLCNKSSQCGVSNVIGGVEAGVQHHIKDEEESILSGQSPGSGHGEDCEQASATAKIRPQHPGTGLAHFSFSLVNEGAEDDIGESIKNLGNSHQSADDPGVQPDGIGQIDHHEEGQERIHHIARDVAGTIADLVIPFQISFFLHFNSPSIPG